ncbi:hypothetical protein HCN44_005585 [Aphidius gifuensis]|uniref:Uncharacterized protein n=1 Tax=Aphidius gifuensis TaxID=684658 RepID=A0A835CXC0_APHGI|nr:hypothetical protein HCN44_005585 [Aphidius gifuensis]
MRLLQSANFFLATLKKFSLIQQFTNELTISNIEIESNSQFNFKSYDSIGKITNNCAKNIIYMLKYNASNETKKTLEVIHYDGNKKFQRIKQVENMFDNAISITSDYKTGKIYWAVNDNGNYSIKVTDELFSKWNYIIYPNNKYPIGKIQVYPKGSGIFFSKGDDIWYTSNSLNSTPKLLASDGVIDFAIDYATDNSLNSTPKLLASDGVIDFAIDYATDNLCWIQRDLYLHNFYCANITTPSQPKVERGPKFINYGMPTGNLGAFNNTFYWTENIMSQQLLFANDGYETTVKFGKNINDGIQSFVSLNCPYISDKEINFLLIVNASQISTLEYSTKDVNLSKNPIEIKHSRSFKIHDNIEEVTSYCANNSIFILRYSNISNVINKTIDVLRYKGNNKFERTVQVVKNVNDVVSIASDYTTGKIYWAENKNNNEFSIKVTNGSFEKAKYIIRPNDKISIKNLQVYPKRNKIFFTSHDHLWYTSCLSNNTVSLLYPNPKRELAILDLTIDYVTDKLCWITYFKKKSYIYCAAIDISDRQLIKKEIVLIDAIPKVVNNLVAFNNTFYWTTNEEIGQFNCTLAENQLMAENITEESMTIQLEYVIYSGLKFCKLQLENNEGKYYDIVRYYDATRRASLLSKNDNIEWIGDVDESCAFTIYPNRKQDTLKYSFIDIYKNMRVIASYNHEDKKLIHFDCPGTYDSTSKTCDINYVFNLFLPNKEITTGGKVTNITRKAPYTNDTITIYAPPVQYRKIKACSLNVEKHWHESDESIVTYYNTSAKSMISRDYEYIGYKDNSCSLKINNLNVAQNKLMDKNLYIVVDTEPAPIQYRIFDLNLEHNHRYEYNFFLNPLSWWKKNHFSKVYLRPKFNAIGLFLSVEPQYF